MMKKNIVYALVILALFAFTGCQKANSNLSSKQQPKNDEKDFAINTFQTGSEYTISVSMSDLKNAVKKIIDNRYWPDTVMTKEELHQFTQINEDMYSDYMAEYQRTKTGLDCLIIIRANEDKIQDVEKLLNQYRDNLLQQYDEQLQNKAKITASRIETIENYVCFVQLGADTSHYVEEGEEKIILVCQQENERAIDAIEKTILK